MKGRFCRIDRTHSECGWNLVEIMIQVLLLSPKSGEDQKRSHRKSNDIYRLNRAKTKKKGLYRN